MGTYHGIMVSRKINCCNRVVEALGSTSSESNMSIILWAANKAILTWIILQKNPLTFVATNKIQKWTSVICYKNNSSHKLVSAYLTWSGNLAQEFAVWKERWVGLQCSLLCAVCTASQQLIPLWDCHTAFSATAAMCSMGNGEGTPWLLQLTGEVMTNVSLLLFCPLCTVFPTHLFPSPVQVWLGFDFCMVATPQRVSVGCLPQHGTADTTAVQVFINNTPRKAGSCQKHYACAAMICYSGYRLHLPRSARNNAPAQEDQGLLPREQFSHCLAPLLWLLPLLLPSMERDNGTASPPWPGCSGAPNPSLLFLPPETAREASPRSSCGTTGLLAGHKL